MIPKRLLQRTLEVAMKPLLNERYLKGQEEGLEEKQREWEAWLMRRRESGEFAWDDEDPPPSNGDGRE